MVLTRWLHKIAQINIVDIFPSLHPSAIEKRRAKKCNIRGHRFETLRYDHHMNPTFRMCQRCDRPEYFDTYTNTWTLWEPNAPEFTADRKTTAR